MSSLDKQSHTLIIARYNEDISWIKNVPEWKPVQPLSCRWRKEMQVPPAGVVNMDDRFFIDNLKVRIEYFSVYTLAPIHFS